MNSDTGVSPVWATWRIGLLNRRRNQHGRDARVTDKLP